ncbi:MAG TPA: SUMF1/EgtB/PvdO family nonheme iron enzyme [Thermoanaerobaculia bacterium]
MASQATARSTVFISYSHKDSEWHRKLSRHLQPLERDFRIETWDDTKIESGERWRSEILRAVQTARVAVLLVSADFMASDFIAKNELPPLLHAAEGEGLVILPLILSPCRFLRDPNLSVFQAVNDPAKPLVGMHESDQEEVLDRVAQRIEAVLRDNQPLHNFESHVVGSGPSLYPDPPSIFATPQSLHMDILQELLATYYRCLANECGHLPLGTIASEYISKRDEDRISLASVYVRLDVRNAAREEGDESDRTWALRLAIGDEKDRTPLLDAVASPQQRFHVLLGEGGSGKTSLINYLTFQLITCGNTLPEELNGLLPFHLVLREVAAKHSPESGKGSAEIFWHALRDDIRHHFAEDAAHSLLGYLQQRMLREGALVLLDGLDEVPEANRRREILLEAIWDLVNVLDHPRSRFLVTARPYAYADPRWQLSNFTAWSLSPFNEVQQREFIHLWYKAVRPCFGWSEDTADSKSTSLQYALKDRPYLREIAGRPLFLTLMAALHSNRGQLPEDRAELYEETVRLMLSRWQRAREVRGPDGEMVLEPGITEALNVGEARIRSALELLAYRVHEKQRLRPEDRIGPADISRGEVLEAFEPLLDSVKLQTLLNYLENRAGLLIERKTGVFAFPHRSFQEYLAACHFADEADFPEDLIDKVNSDYSWWREVFLLAVGKARRGGLQNAISIVVTLLPHSIEDVDNPGEKHWRNSVLAGESLWVLRLRDQAIGREHHEALLRRVRRWLVELLKKGELSSVERCEAGDILGHLKDPRKGVGIIIRRSGRLVPEIDWVTIPAGEFIMGSSAGGTSHTNECPAHRVYMPTYLISRYPVTNDQFRPFVENGGYRERKYWSPAGWDWVRGGVVDFSPIGDRRMRERYVKWMSRRPKVKEAPDSWEDSFWNRPTRPVIGINWYEAMAFAAWLDELYELEDLKEECGATLLSTSRDVRIRLPTEAEWEKAARGNEGNIWPWGNEKSRGRANTKEEGLETTSPVGTFPDGASPFGVLDMAGNIWEWTVTRWGYASYLEPDYIYPYDPHDGREDEEGTDIRIVRGSSWFGGLDDFARCAFRGWGFTFNASTFSGMRLVLARNDRDF